MTEVGGTGREKSTMGFTGSILIQDGYVISMLNKCQRPIASNSPSSQLKKYEYQPVIPVAF